MRRAFRVLALTVSVLVISAASVPLAGCRSCTPHCPGSIFGGPNPQAAIDAAYQQIGVCYKAVIDRPEYAALLPHTSLGEIPASELANDQLPTPEEARLEVARWDALAPCRQAFLPATARPPAGRPDVASIFLAFYAEKTAQVARFSHGHMTWGEYAARAQALRTALTARLNEADAVEANRIAEANREASDRALEVLSIMQPHQITPFSCSGEGNYFSCH